MTDEGKLEDNFYIIGEKYIVAADLSNDCYIYENGKIEVSDLIWTSTPTYDPEQDHDEEFLDLDIDFICASTGTDISPDTPRC